MLTSAKERRIIPKGTEINPLGYLSKEVVSNFINSQKFSPNVNVVNGDILQKFTENDETQFYIGFVQKSKLDKLEYRVNPVTFRPFFFEKLKDKHGNETYFNTKDVFGGQKNIDEIYRLNKHWHKQCCHMARNLAFEWFANIAIFKPLYVLITFD